mgnify:CR=1 FL=1
MPLIQVTLLEGRDNEVVEKAMKEIAKTAAESLNAPLEAVRVVVYEVERNRFAVGTKLKSEE